MIELSDPHTMINYHYKKKYNQPGWPCLQRFT